MNCSLHRETPEHSTVLSHVTACCYSSVIYSVSIYRHMQSFLHIYHSEVQNYLVVRYLVLLCFTALDVV